jgi:hypothetical protein
LSLKDKNLINWPAPYTEGKLISFRPPIFKQYEDIFDKEDINLIESLHDYMSNKKSLLIEDSECGPSIEFYFNKYVPIFHVFTFDLRSKTYTEYQNSVKHFLLTITDEFLNDYNKTKDVLELISIHDDPHKVYQLKLNQIALYCKFRKIFFSPINEFFNFIHQNYEIHRLRSNIESKLFLNI